jgi:hypothetical protein
VFEIKNIREREDKSREREASLGLAKPKSSTTSGGDERHWQEA